MTRHESILLAFGLLVFQNVILTLGAKPAPHPVHAFDLSNLTYISTQRF